MNKLIPLGLLLIVVVAVAGFFILKDPSSPSLSLPGIQQEKAKNILFDNPKKSAHYETNTPTHASTLAGVPVNVSIDFNFDLTAPSELKIEKDGDDYGVGETIIDDNKLTMRRNMDPNAPDGIYTVTYNACWPDKTCHDGHFQFAIERTTTTEFEDLTGQATVTINMSQLQFMPMNIKISKGTKVNWINDDEVEHYVNTDPHPAHTYYPSQNSQTLQQGDVYSVTFNTPGAYPYHCSAHAHSMVGSILVK